MEHSSAADYARDLVARVSDDPGGRLELLRRIHGGSAEFGHAHLPYRRAAVAFMAWQLRRNLLNPVAGPRPGSPWWRAVNERLLRDGCEARALVAGRGGPPSAPTVQCAVDFISRPRASTWYRAHNASLVAAYFEHEDLALAENRAERFFINLVLVRVLYAHALVAAPRLALGWLAPAAPALGDPRLGMTGIFLSLSRVLPGRYPLGPDLERYLTAELGLGHLLDVGVILPRAERLYEWSARELELPDLPTLLQGRVPAYAWDPEDAQPWHPPPSLLARCVQRLLPSTQ